MRMTRVLTVLIALVMLALPWAAGAEIVGRTADSYIHRWTADNGQELYFVTNTEEARVTYDDVNFDGHPDLAVVTAQGASNARYEFYLWNNGVYEYAERWTGDIINYSLADGKYVVSMSDDGNAGMLFHAEICVWDGPILKTLRTMVAEEETDIAWEGRIMTKTMNLDRLHVVLWEQDSPAGAAEILWENTYAPLPEGAGFMDEIHARLWQGLTD